MADIKHVIEPERFGIWIAVTFVIALLALVMAFIAINRADEAAMITQTEILLLNKKIEGSQPAVAAPAEAEAVAE
jgi:hypothetical protein